MRILKLLFEPYKKLPWGKLLSVFYTTFALWCFNLGVLLSFLIILPFLMRYPENVFEAWGRFIEIWFISPGQLYYFFFCFIISLILNFSK